MNRVEDLGTHQWALHCAQAIGRSVRLLAAAAWLIGLGRLDARAQLVITELMSSGTRCPGGTLNPDFWELTNFGTNSIDLSGYRWWDDDDVAFGSANLLPSTNIGPGESIIIVVYKSGAPSHEAAAAAFRLWWWGDSNLQTNLQIYSSDRAPFNQPGEACRLWDPTGNLIDRAVFPEAELEKGITFSSDPVTGEFGVPSQTNVCGAFKSARCDDVGSPGTNGCTRPIPLSIVKQPVSTNVLAGSDVTFDVRAIGLPRPRYQWYSNGAPIPRAPLTSDLVAPVVNYAGCGLVWQYGPKPTELRIANVQTNHAGQYFVVVFNGLEQMTSAVVTLTVNSVDTPPRIECPPTEWRFPSLAGQPQTNLILSTGQPANLDVVVRGYPPPTIAWSRKSVGGTSFVPVLEATNHRLEISSVGESDSGTYRVWVTNSQGAAFADATLTVKPKPALRITEAMSHSCLGDGRDWWELTNTGDEPVNLTGYRWNDDEPARSIIGGPTITNAVILQPGESVIFLEGRRDHTPASFIESWGAENLPPNLQFIVYSANGLGESADEITLWNQSTTDHADYIHSVRFEQATPGVSFWSDADVCSASSFPEYSRRSSSDECGAFRAANRCDVGSPGWTRWTPSRMTSIRRAGMNAILEWRAQPGSTNRLQFVGALAAPPTDTVWTNLGTYSFAEATATATDGTIGNDRQRFYRVVRVAPARCECPQDEEF